MANYSDDQLAALTLCTKREVPADKWLDAAEAAVEENQANAAMRSSPAPSGGGGSLELAVFTEKRWLPGRTISVSFLDGDDTVKNRLIPFAKEWEEHANLTFDFRTDGQSEANIRISFEHQGSWSYLGTDALVIDPSEPTMNFGWLTPASADEEYSRVVLHEFGHAIAAIHEQQSPVADIPWDKEAVYRYYALQGWDREQTDRNVLRRRDRKLFNHTQYDSTSIMQYAVPNALTIGDFEIPWNTVLSPLDMEFIGTMYPGLEPETVGLELGQTVAGEIGAPGEEDRYRLEVEDRRLVTLETGGNTDVVMSLFGPDDDTFLADFDDDSGLSLNARISRELAPGTYLVRIRHYSKNRGGPYQLSAK